MAEPTTAIIGIIGLIIIISVGAYAMSQVWHVSDTVVTKYGNSQLQKSYLIGKTAVNTASDIKDGSDLTRSVVGLSMMVIGVPTLITIIRKW